MSDSNWFNVAFWESFTSQSKSVVLIIIFTLKNDILSNIGNPIHSDAKNMKAFQPCKKFKYICDFF